MNKECDTGYKNKNRGEGGGGNAITYKPVTISIQRFSGSDTIDVGRLPFNDDFHPSSAFNLAHVMSLSESGVSRFTEIMECACIYNIRMAKRVIVNK